MLNYLLHAMTCRNPMSSGFAPITQCKRRSEGKSFRFDRTPGEPRFGVTLLRPGPFLPAHLSRKEGGRRKEPRNRRRSHFPTFLSRTALRPANPRCRRQAERAPPRPMSVRRTDGLTGKKGFASRLRKRREPLPPLPPPAAAQENHRQQQQQRKRRLVVVGLFPLFEWSERASEVVLRSV